MDTIQGREHRVRTFRTTLRSRQRVTAGDSFAVALVNDPVYAAVHGTLRRPMCRPG